MEGSVLSFLKAELIWPSGFRGKAVLEIYQ
jgi:hypothetical protein